MLGECEKCSDEAVGFDDDGAALCSDCLFEQSCEEIFYSQEFE